MNTTAVLLRAVAAVSLRSAWLMRRACRPMWAARQAADAQRDVEADAARRNRADLGDVAARQRHDRAFAELLFDGRDGAGHRLQFLFHAGHGSLLGQVVG